MMLIPAEWKRVGEPTMVRVRLRFTLTLLFCCSPAFLVAQTEVLDKEAYLEPPAPIVDQVLAPWEKNYTLQNLGPDEEHFLVGLSDGLVPLETMAAPYAILGETALDTQALRSRRLTVRAGAGYRLHAAEDGAPTEVNVPEGARVSDAKWSPKGNQFAFMAHFKDASYLYIADCETGETRRLCERPLLATMVTDFDWSLDGEQIAAVFVPEGVKMPKRSKVATEPKVRVARQGARPSRTYRFLLETPDDQALLEYLVTGQLAVVDVSSSQMTSIGEPRMYLSVDMSPRGDAFRVVTMLKPFSYFDPTRRFGRRDEIVSRDGEMLTLISERKLDDEGDDEEEETKKEPEKRALTWRPDGAGLSFLQKEPKPKKEESDDNGNGDAGKDDAVTQDTKPDTKPDDQADDDPSGDDGEESKQEEKKKPKQKDRVMLWKYPFGDDNVHVVYESEEEIRSVQYAQNAKTLFISQTIKKQPTIFAVQLKQPEEPLLIYQRPARGERGSRGDKSSQDDTDASDDDDSDQDDSAKDQDSPAKDRGAKRGSLMTQSTAAGDRYVRLSRKGHVYFSGTDSDDEEEEDGEEEEADKSLPAPFIDQVNIVSGKVENLYTGDGEMLESLEAFVAPHGKHKGFVVVTRQLHDVVPDSYRIPLETQEAVQLTANKNYAPWFQKLEKIRFQVERVDGFKFWVTAYRNPDYGMKLPAMFWFYPREYDDQEAYDRSARRSDSPRVRERFDRPRTRSMTHLTQIGYVVVQPDCPIVGERGKWNDNFIPDLRNNLWAVIQAMDKTGWVDVDRLAIGGHSYGAFGTANALAHTPFFKAGIAGDGNFNRTLTPMSFQREPRFLWNAREIYTGMSPLLWADQIHGALLMYHGADDTNVGTWPIHSERMFQALDGIGRPAAMYMYPYEGHGQIGKETVLDMWARWVEWLDVYVKHPERGKAAQEKEDDKEADD